MVEPSGRAWLLVFAFACTLTRSLARSLDRSFADQSHVVLAQEATQLLLSKGAMLEEYFGIQLRPLTPPPRATAAGGGEGEEVFAATAAAAAAADDDVCDGSADGDGASDGGEGERADAAEELCLHALPSLLGDWLPLSAALPLFLLRLATEVRARSLAHVCI